MRGCFNRAGPVELDARKIALAVAAAEIEAAEMLFDLEIRPRCISASRDFRCW